ncbi:MAG: DUF6116 family protein [Pseudomonadota bacterium]
MAVTNPVSWLTGYASRLKFPKLLAVTAALFIIDVLVPDVVPFADELLLGLVTAVLASLRERAHKKEPEQDDSTTTAQ